MIAASHRPYATHLVRLVVSLALSLVSLVAMLAGVRASSALQNFSWYVLPLSVAVGFAPMIRWYGRDAFPIGVAYCPVVFLLLRYLGEVISQSY